MTQKISGTIYNAFTKKPQEVDGVNSIHRITLYLLFTAGCEIPSNSIVLYSGPFYEPEYEISGYQFAYALNPDDPDCAAFKPQYVVIARTDIKMENGEWMWFHAHEETFLSKKDFDITLDFYVPVPEREQSYLSAIAAGVGGFVGGFVASRAIHKRKTP